MQVATNGGNGPCRQVRNGQSINDLAFSASAAGDNAVFSNILSLYVVLGISVAHVTSSKGVCWCNILDDEFSLLAINIKDGLDFRY